MIGNLQKMRRSQRIVIYVLMLGGALLLLATLATIIALLIINRSGRPVGTPLMPGVTVSQFAALPDDDAYPATVAVGPDGRVYTGSYASGAVWVITPAGELSEVPATREVIGAITGLTVAADGTLYVLDRLVVNPRSGGGVIWRIGADGAVVPFGQMPPETNFIAPDDITTDPAGHVYVTDRGRREVWRFNTEAMGEVWWAPPSPEHNNRPILPTGLAYNPVTNRILISDSEAGLLYSVTLDGQQTELLYAHPVDQDNPGFDGLSVGADGTVYIAALAAREVVALGADDRLMRLAGNFRGVSDVAFYDGRLYITNFDQRSLVLPGIQPQLPFALDVMTFD